MTLKEVAAAIRRVSKLDAKQTDGAYQDGWDAGSAFAVRAFEADPDFTLRERLEALAVELSYRGGPGPKIHSNEVARRLRELLNGGGT